MSDVPQSWRMVLEALTAGTSWMTPASVAERLGLDVEETTDVLACLDEAGLVSVRESEGPAALLVAASPRGTELVRPSVATRPAPSRDRRPANTWNASYDRPSRPRIAATAVGSVAS